MDKQIIDDVAAYITLKLEGEHVIGFNDVTRAMLEREVRRQVGPVLESVRRKNNRVLRESFPGVH